MVKDYSGGCCTSDSLTMVIIISSSDGGIYHSALVGQKKGDTLWGPFPYTLLLRARLQRSPSGQFTVCGFHWCRISSAQRQLAEACG